MRWVVFALAAYVMVALQMALAPMLAIATPLGTVEPRFVLLLGVLVGLAAPPVTAMVALAVLGLLLDVTTTWTLADGGAMTLVGPYVLGYLAAGCVLLEVRPLLFRHHPLTLGSMSLAGGAAVHLIVVAVFAIRAWYEPLAGWSADEQLAARGLGLIYTAAIGVLLAVPLNALSPLFGLPGAKKSSRSRRR